MILYILGVLTLIGFFLLLKSILKDLMGEIRSGGRR